MKIKLTTLTATKVFTYYFSYLGRTEQKKATVEKGKYVNSFSLSFIVRSLIEAIRSHSIVYHSRDKRQRNFFLFFLIPIKILFYH